MEVGTVVDVSIRQTCQALRAALELVPLAGLVLKLGGGCLPQTIRRLEGHAS